MNKHEYIGNTRGDETFYLDEDKVANSCLKCGQPLSHPDHSFDTQDERQQKIVELKNQFIKELPENSLQYQVTEITEIVDIHLALIKDNIENPEYVLTEIVESRIRKFKAALFEAMKMELEFKNAIVIDQKMMNQLVPKLREEERLKFKDYDISYKPQAVVTTKVSGVTAPRMSAIDRAYADTAARLGLTVEQYKKNLEKQLLNLGLKCICAEAPGTCKIHPSTK